MLILHAPHLLVIQWPVVLTSDVTAGAAQVCTDGIKGQLSGLHRGWVDKALAMQLWGPEFDPEPMSKPGGHVGHEQSCSWEVESWNPQPKLAGQTTENESSDHSERLCLTHQIESEVVEGHTQCQPQATTYMHAHTQAPPHTHVSSHMCEHAQYHIHVHRKIKESSAYF